MGLPKGNRFHGSARSAALEEAYEEAGVLGEIRNSRRVRLERSRWTLDLYVARGQATAILAEKGRRTRRWVPIHQLDSGCADGTCEGRATAG